jgi:hypothetical protein
MERTGDEIRAERARRRIVNGDPERYGSWIVGTHRGRADQLLRWAELYARWAMMPEKAYPRGEPHTDRRAQELAIAAEACRAAARAIALVSWTETPPRSELALPRISEGWISATLRPMR